MEFKFCSIALRSISDLFSHAKGTLTYSRLPAFAFTVGLAVSPTMWYHNIQLRAKQRMVELLHDSIGRMGRNAVMGFPS
jgi:hypothetical protein